MLHLQATATTERDHHSLGTSPRSRRSIGRGRHGRRGRPAIPVRTMRDRRPAVVQYLRQAGRSDRPGQLGEEHRPHFAPPLPRLVRQALLVGFCAPAERGREDLLAGTFAGEGSRGADHFTSAGSDRTVRRSWLRHRIHRSWHHGHAELGFAGTGDRPFEGRWSWSQ
jgi:hypothetical protein